MNDLTLFFCSSKLIKDIAPTIPNPKIGCTTAGEIDNGIKSCPVFLKFDSHLFNTEIVKIPNTTLPILYTDELINAAKKVHLDKKHLLCIVLNDGLSESEDMLQSFLYNILPKDAKIIGGSSADDLDFKETFCCVNDDVFVGAAVLFIGTNQDFYINAENAFKASNKRVIVTRSIGRTIYELDNKPAKIRYSEIMNCPINEVESLFNKYPFGTYYNKRLLVCSPLACNEDNSIFTHKSTLPSTILWILKSSNYKETLQSTTNIILSKGDPLFTITINCIKRKLQFDSEKSSYHLENCFRKIKAFGFTSYGEQIDDIHVNQSMITLTFFK